MIGSLKKIFELFFMVCFRSIVGCIFCKAMVFFVWETSQGRNIDICPNPSCKSLHSPEMDSIFWFYNEAALESGRRRTLEERMTNLLRFMTQ